MKVSVVARAALPLIGLGLLISSAGCSGSTPPPEGGSYGACPPPRHQGGVCIQVVVWTKNPGTGQCCEYGNPCVAPEGWETFYSPEACEQAP
jgi:hypothetical protein